MKAINILGISGQERDAAAALVTNGSLVAAIEEEKVARIKHVGMNYAGGLPTRAIQFCLDRGGVTLSDIDFVAYYIEPYKLFRRSVAFRAGRVLRRPGLSSLQAFSDHFANNLDKLMLRLRTRRLIAGKLAPSARFVAVNHQFAHAASAFYVSGFDRAAVVVAGNRGDLTTVSLMTASQDGLRALGEARFPNSLGLVYGAVTEALGFGSNGDEHKTMWLAPTGVPRFKEIFEDLLRVSDEGLPVVNMDYFDGSSLALSSRLFEQIGTAPRGPDSPLTGTHRDVAASLQARLEDVLCEVVARHRERTAEENLCMAGGVALNSMAVSAIERRTGIKRIFVQPAAGNSGCSVGAALYVWHDLLGNRDRAYEMKHVFLGPAFDQEAIKEVLDNCKLAYHYFLTEEKLVAEVAQLLERGKIVAWFRGPMEFGPRTLGARCILASPTAEWMRDNLNAYVKHREDFRPFSAAVPEDRLSEFFEPSDLARFLQSVSRVKGDAAARLPAAIFGDGLVRVQAVSRDSNATFWKLLVRFGELTGVPVLLNTSFNLFGEPVVSTPREAVRGFYCSGLDCLAIGDFLIEK